MNDAFINHVMACRECYAPARRYCNAGQECKVLSDAEFVLSLPKIEQRRREMEILKVAHPGLYSRTEALVKKLFEERKAQPVAA